jgi:membrane dipeptidase
MPRIIDAHLDLSWCALGYNRDLTQSLQQINQQESYLQDNQARGHATVSLPALQRSEVVICLGTLLVRSRKVESNLSGPLRIDLDFCTPEIAYAVAQGQRAYYRLLAQQGKMRLIEDVHTLKSHWQSWGQPSTVSQPLGLILAMEGADPIVTPAQLPDWYADGLRALNLVHYGTNQYAVGTGHSGPLTVAGRQLLAEMEKVGMVLDTTHLSDPSFFDTLDNFSGPVIASHQNCRALVPGERQFSDEQICLLLERDAVLGVALDNWMLLPGWKTGTTPRAEVTLQLVADQIDHLCQLAGNHHHVAIGTDLDGGFGSEQSPRDIESIADLQLLAPILEQRGYTADAIDAIFHGNWLRYFLQHLPTTA